MEIDRSVRSIPDFTDKHFKLTGYDPHPHIKAEVAV
jgi:thymidylate synthase